MQFFHLLNHLGREILVADHCHPRRRGVAAAGELFIDRRVTGAAVGRGDAVVDDESIVVGAGLAGEHLMTVEARHALLRVLAHLVFVDDGILVVAVALGALAAGLDEIRIGLVNDDARSLRVDEICRDDQPGGDDDGNEDGAEVHGASFSLVLANVNSLQ